jgi:hypothetical protein
LEKGISAGLNHGNVESACRTTPWVLQGVYSDVPQPAHPSLVFTPHFEMRRRGTRWEHASIPGDGRVSSEACRECLQQAFGSKCVASRKR